LETKKTSQSIAEDSNGHSARVRSDAANKRRSSHGDVRLRRLRPRPVLRCNAADATSAAEAATASTRCIRVGTIRLLSIRRSLLRVGIYNYPYLYFYQNYYLLSKVGIIVSLSVCLSVRTETEK